MSEYKNILPYILGAVAVSVYFLIEGLIGIFREEKRSAKYYDAVNRLIYGAVSFPSVILFIIYRMNILKSFSFSRFCILSSIFIAIALLASSLFVAKYKYKMASKFLIFTGERELILSIIYLIAIAALVILHGF